MAAIRELVLAALKARLETLKPGYMGLEVFRNRTKALPAPALSILDGPQQTDSGIVAVKRNSMTATIAGYVEADSDDEIGAAINDLYGRTIDALEADVSLGGVAFDLRESALDVDLESEGDDAPIKAAAGWFRLTVEIEFTTRPGDSGSLAP